MLSAGAIIPADYDAAVAEPLGVTQLPCDSEAREILGPRPLATGVLSLWRSQGTEGGRARIAAEAFDAMRRARRP